MREESQRLSELKSSGTKRGMEREGRGERKKRERGRERETNLIPGSCGFARKSTSL